MYLFLLYPNFHQSDVLVFPGYLYLKDKSLVLSTVYRGQKKCEKAFVLAFEIADISQFP